jgi:hypothetical protein
MLLKPFSVYHIGLAEVASRTAPLREESLFPSLVPSIAVAPATQPTSAHKRAVCPRGECFDAIVIFFFYLR